MSTAAKVALATTAGAAIGATAAGLATSEKARQLRQKVTRKVKDLVSQGSITLKNSRLHDVVEEFEHMIGGMLGGGGRGRGYESQGMMRGERGESGSPITRRRSSSRTSGSRGR